MKATEKRNPNKRNWGSEDPKLPKSQRRERRAERGAQRAADRRACEVPNDSDQEAVPNE
jgi:hypothetical protein